jgi:hypothetical protein
MSGTLGSAVRTVPGMVGVVIEAREKRRQSMAQTKPSDIVRRYFGPKSSVELRERARFGFKAVDLQDPSHPYRR